MGKAKKLSEFERGQITALSAEGIQWRSKVCHNVLSEGAATYFVFELSGSFWGESYLGVKVIIAPNIVEKY